MGWHRAWSPILVTALRSAADAAGGPCPCTLGPATAWFPGGRVLQVPVAGLDRTADAVRSALRHVVRPDPDDGDPNDGTPFRGHVTMARADPRQVHRAARAAVDGIPVTASFVADAVHLVATRRTPDGPRYVTLGTAPLPG